MIRGEHVRAGQSTLEFALVISVFMSVVLGLWALTQYIEDGHADTRIISHSSHRIDGATPGGWGDVIVY